MKTQAIILAAGKGTRMEDLSRPKVMFEVLGKPLLEYSLHNVQSAGVKDIILVVGYKKEKVEEYFGARVEYAFQQEQLGTGHAVKCGLEKISSDTDAVLVCYGDMPLYRPESICRLMRDYELYKPVIAMFSVFFEQPDYWAYGRIIRDESDKVTAIVEQKDCTVEQRNIRECNPGFYIFDAQWLRKNISRLKDTNAQKEYYLTDLVGMAVKQQQKVIALPVSEEAEALGINTKQQLKEAEEVLKKRKS